MKKGIISIIIVLLLALVYFALVRSINIGFLKVESIKGIKEASNKLDEEMNKAQVVSEQTYPSSAALLDEAIQELKNSKQEYTQKLANTGENIQIGAMEVKTYKIHYLWTVLGNYRKDEGVDSLNLDLKSTQSKDIYDLEFTLVGEYNSISDFISDIENDDNLNFEIEKFLMEPYTTKTEITVTDANTDKTIVKSKVNPYNAIIKIVSDVLSASDAVTNNTANTNTQADANTTSNTTNTTTTSTTTTKSSGGTSTTTIYDPKWVQTTFTVKNIGIELD